MILIAGDHDEVTQAVARQLLEAGLGVRLLSASPTSLALLGAGAQVALYRSGERLSVQSAFDEVTRLCLPACRTDEDARTQVICIECATALAISRVVKVSGAPESSEPPADPGWLSMSEAEGEGVAPREAKVEFDVADRAVEEALRRSHLPHTIVRHAVTFQDLWFVAWTNPDHLASRSSRVAAVDAEDVAMVILDSLVEDGIAVSDECVTGPDALSLSECLERIRLSGEMAGTGEAANDVRLWRRLLHVRTVGPSVVTDSVRRVTGEAPMPFESFLERMATRRDAD